jgi:prepilin-type processing-associated H-X9-DG protein
MSLAIAFYTDDYRQFYPQVAYYDDAGQWTPWYGQIFYYLRISKSTLNSDYASVLFGKGDWYRRCPSGIARCPLPESNGLGGGMYAINGADSPDYASGFWTKSYGICGARTDWFPYPDQTALLLDTEALRVWTSCYRILAGAQDWVSDMHNKSGGNVIYLDGHAKHLTPAFMPVESKIFFGIYPQGRSTVSP